MRHLVLLCLLLLSYPSAAQAREVAGITIPDTAQLHTNGTTLTLNGAGIRRNLFMSIYVGALYLPQAARDPASILVMPGAKRFSMHIVHSELPAEKLVKTWTEGFERNSSPEQFRALRTRIANFNGLFPTLHKGDRVDIDTIHIPDGGISTQVWLNDQWRGQVAGREFANALLRIWLGEHPVDASLKKNLLGGE